MSKQTPPRVLLSPNLEGMGSGLTSTIGYDNPDFRAGLNVMFNVKAGERITQIEMQDDWMTARLETIQVAEEGTNDAIS